MKRVFYLALISFLAILLAFCSKKEVSRISGSIEGIDSTVQITIYRQYFHKVEEISKVELSNKKNSFSFSLGELSEPTFFQLFVQSKRQDVAVLLLEPGEQTEIKIDLSDFLNYQILGSETSIKTQQLSQKISQTRRKVDSLVSVLEKNDSQAERQAIIEEYNRIIEQQRKYSTSFIWENLRCRSSVMALYQQIDSDFYVFDRPEDLTHFRAVATQLQSMYPESDYTEGMLRDVRNQLQTISSFRLQELVAQAEPELPEIALPNHKGDTIRLSSLRGKVILLDFWASFSTESLMENRELLEIYKQYRGRGFEVYQVSLDIEREPWLAAINSAKLPWINVSELDPEGSYIAALYNVTQIPTNYLIDKNFEIAGKNLYGEELVRRLREIL